MSADMGIPAQHPSGSCGTVLTVPNVQADANPTSQTKTAAQTTEKSSVLSETSTDLPTQEPRNVQGDSQHTETYTSSHGVATGGGQPTSSETFPSVASRSNVLHPRCFAHAESIFFSDALRGRAIHNNFLKGCKWAPDGLCLLTCNDDNILRLFNFDSAAYSTASSPTCAKPSEPSMHMDSDYIDSATTMTSSDNSADSGTGAIPEMRCDLRMGEGELIYDYCWYPFMSSYDPSTCCLLSSSRDHPVHLWDAFTGKIRCTYRPYNHLDEITSAYSVAFSSTGSQIYMGFKECVRVFDVTRPGRMCESRPCSKDGQKGILSCIVCAPHDKKIYACGSYSKSIGLYDDSARKPGRPWGLLDTAAGVTQVAFSPDGQRLYSGCRQTGDVQCWDLRNTIRVLYVYERQLATNQRLHFDITPVCVSTL